VRTELHVERARLAARGPLRISGYEFSVFEAVRATLRQDGLVGRGEAAGVYYHDETPEVMAAQIEAVRAEIEDGAGRERLLRLLAPGGARNALDSALWELEARRAGRRVWELAGVPQPKPLRTTFTIGADSPAAMAAQARGWTDAVAIKLKLTGNGEDGERVRAVRAARPDVWLMVDANQGFTPDLLDRLIPVLVEARVQLIEQPFPIERDADMDGFSVPIRVAADESFQDHHDIEKIAYRFDVVNIKLDKCGGLTEALAIAREARRRGLGLMVGNMWGTSLAMAPAFVLGQLCDVIDLDGPLHLAVDPEPRARYANGCIDCPDEVWGAPASDAT
jgi:L-Ala-D/L-Glu epimerase / N-acetyl-D-glutamate racemase